MAIATKTMGNSRPLAWWTVRMAELVVKSGLTVEVGGEGDVFGRLLGKAILHGSRGSSKLLAEGDELLQVFDAQGSPRSC